MAAKAAKKKKILGGDEILQLMIEAGEEGDGIHHVTDEEWDAPRDWFSSGNRMIDGIVDNGGFGSGRLVEIYGPEASGKSELLRTMVQAFVRKNPDGIAFVYDQETAADPKKWQSIRDEAGGRVVVSYAATMEAFFKNVTKMLEILADTDNKTPVLIALDSVMGLQTALEEKTDLMSDIMMAKARVLSRALPKVRRLLNSSNSITIFVNQIRTKPGSMGEDESPGGKALKFWADYRLRTYNMGRFYISKSKVDDDGPKEPPDGFIMKVFTKKNKLSIPMREIQSVVMYKARFGQPSGLSDAWSTLHFLRQNKAVSVRGGRYFLDGCLESSFAVTDWPMVYEEHKDIIDKTLVAPFFEELMGDREPSNVVVEPDVEAGEPDEAPTSKKVIRRKDSDE